MAKNLFFVGDSLIEFYDWQPLFPGHRVSNLGRAGDTVRELMERLPAILTLAPPPDWLLMMIGTNNVCMEDFAFLPDYETLITRIRNRLPHAALTVNSLLPVTLPYLAGNVTARLNQLLREMAVRCGVRYLDALTPLTGDSGTVLPGVLFPDGVHLARRGYDLWGDAIHRHLLELFP
ncbi:MAG: GDSL-type esterase/lipase family protein [Desulfobulbaceae bacterium]|nr:GDSL-type esterase/lipase family protein [Desulfobulbaceae bacterium]